MLNNKVRVFHAQTHFKRGKIVYFVPTDLYPPQLPMDNLFFTNFFYQIFYLHALIFIYENLFLFKIICENLFLSMIISENLFY